MHKHFKIYKPYGYLSQFVNQHKRRKNKKMLGKLYDFPKETMSVGRLDEDSEGLLILTTDGKMSYKILSQSVEKEYYVQVDGEITLEAIEQLKKGLGKPYTTLPCNAFLLEEKPTFPERAKKIRDERHGPTSWASITLTEGKFRQVKKMTAAVGFPTLRLVRVRVGNIRVDGLNAGEVKEVTQEVEEKFL
mgnify:CR=1 FL=1